MAFYRAWPFVFLLIIPPLWWMRSRSLNNFNRRQSMLQAGVRSVLIASLVLALTQPIAYRTARWLSVVYAVDVSGSISAASIAATADWIEKTNREGRPDDSRIVVFGKNGAAVASTDELRQIRTAGGRPVDTAATNLEAGLMQAWRAFAPNHLKRLVLVSDGRQTDGDGAAAAARMSRDGVRIYTLAAQTSARQDAWVERVDAPHAVTASEPFHVRAHLYSQAQTVGTLEVRENNVVVSSKEARLSAGANRVDLDARLPREGRAVLEVAWRSAADAVPANNALRAPVFVHQPARILYIEGRPQSAAYLRRALEEGGFTVDVRPPAAMPTADAGLEPYAAVIVSDVARSAIDDRSMAALTTYVAERGGGLIMAGGENVFGGPGLSQAGSPAQAGPRGYSGTEIERVLPVTFTMKEDPEEVAIIIVLDKSWSMAGPFIELAKEAAKAAVDVLGDKHQIGVVTFNDSFDWPVPLQSASNRKDIKDRISTIVPSSHTNIFPALESAGQELQRSKAKTKHVILLSDGQTYPDEYERLVTTMSDSKMTVSTVAVGTEADRILLGNIARWGKGRAYVLENANDVPQIFMKEVEQSARQALIEKPLKPVVKKAVEMFAGLDLEAAPALRGYSGSRAKETAETLLETPSGDPLLARWQFGLGRTAIFTSDVKERWASEWLGWSGYGKFWTQLVRDVTAGGRPDATLTVTRAGAEGRIAVDAIDRSGLPRDLLTPRVEVATQDSDRGTVVDLHQVGPGRYEATVPLSQTADYVVRLLDDPNARDMVLNASSFVVPSSYPEELRVRPADVAFLRAISAETGGTFDPTPADLFARQDEIASTPLRLWPFFAGLALALWLVDILLRRIRIFEPV